MLLGIQQKKAHFLMKKKSAFFSCEHGKQSFPKLTEKTITFLNFNSKIGPFLTENPTTEVYNTLSTPGTTLLLR